MNQTETFDIVIPLGPNDVDIITQQMEYTKKNIIGYNQIYIITGATGLEIPGCIIINESDFPFDKPAICQIFGKETARAGWYLQQLIKLYAPKVITNLSPRYLVIDADTFFLKPTQFIIDGKCAYNFGSEYSREYFKHMSRMSSKFIKRKSMSGICNHMMFETKFVNEIFRIVEKEHKKLFWKVFLEKVRDIDNSGASEYELYFNYILGYHLNEIIIRRLKWTNIDTPNFSEFQQFDYVSYHWYLRK